MEGKNGFLMIISRWLQKKAVITIVTNQGLRNIVNLNSGRAICLPDALPDLPSMYHENLGGKTNIVFICTFGKDEPYNEVFSAASKINRDITIYVTGKYSGKVNTLDLPLNIKLLNYLPEQSYWNLLFSCNIIMDLTTRENCLVCGAYEGIAIGKPLILSNTNTIRSYFKKGCIYVNSDADSIANGITIAVANIKNLQQDIILLKKEMEADWEKSFIEFKNAIEFRIKHN
jgi:glycosyltransferase involved in cell wall biosynthesis